MVRQSRRPDLLQQARRQAPFNAIHRSPLTPGSFCAEQDAAPARRRPASSRSLIAGALARLRRAQNWGGLESGQRAIIAGAAAHRRQQRPSSAGEASSRESNVFALLWILLERTFQTAPTNE